MAIVMLVVETYYHVLLLARAAEYNLRSLLVGTSLMKATYLASNMDTRDTNSTVVLDGTGFFPASEVSWW